MFLFASSDQRILASYDWSVAKIIIPIFLRCGCIFLRAPDAHTFLKAALGLSTVCCFIRSASPALVVYPCCYRTLRILTYHRTCIKQGISIWHPKPHSPKNHFMSTLNLSRAPHESKVRTILYSGSTVGTPEHAPERESHPKMHVGLRRPNDFGRWKDACAWERPRAFTDHYEHL